MSAPLYALCVKFADVNTAQIVNASRKHKVAILHIENYNPSKDYACIFEEYPLEIPAGSHLCLLFILPDGDSFISTKDDMELVFEKVNQYFLQK